MSLCCIAAVLRAFKSAGRAQPEAVAAAAQAFPPIQAIISAAALVLTILRIRIA